MPPPVVGGQQVAQRGEDGNWRYVVDNPYGVSGPRTAEEAAGA